MLRAITVIVIVALFPSFGQGAKENGYYQQYGDDGKLGTRLLRTTVPSRNSVRLLPSNRDNAFERKRGARDKASSSSSRKSSKDKSGKKGRNERSAAPNQPSSVPVKTAAPSSQATKQECSEEKTRRESEAQPSDCQKLADRSTQSPTFPTTRPSTTLPTISPTSIMPTPSPTLTQTISTALPTISTAIPSAAPMISTAIPSAAPTISTAIPSAAPTISTALPTASTLVPSVVITDSPSHNPIVLVQTSTIVAIDIDPSTNASFQDIVEVASLICDQIKTQGNALAAQAAPVIVASDISCAILRDSTADNILLDIGVAFDNSSVFIPGDSEISALICNAVTGQNAATLLGQVTRLPPTNDFSGANSVQCQPASSPSTPAPTEIPTLLPTAQKTIPPSEGPTRHPVTVQPTKAPVQAPTLEPTSGTLAPTFSISTPFPTTSPNTPSPVRIPTSTPTRPTSVPMQSVVPPTTNSPTSSPTITNLAVPTNSPTLQPSVSKQLSPSPLLVTMAPSIAPSLKKTAAPTNTPTLRPATRIPSLPPLTPTPMSVPTALPSRRPSLSLGSPTPTFEAGTFLPTISPTRSLSLAPLSSSPTSGPTSPTLSPIPGTIVTATPFNAVYSVNSLIALEDQDFVEAAETTCDHIRRNIVSTFSSGFIAVESVVCTLQQTNSSEFSIDYELLVVFGPSATSPTTSDVDVLVRTAFLFPASQNLLMDLQGLDGFNPFSTTTAVTYAI